VLACEGYSVVGVDRDIIPAMPPPFILMATSRFGIV
jgi:hypothetical protein